jgi:uncharacterized protein
MTEITETPTEAGAVHDAPIRTVLKRQFEAHLTPGDGRTVDVRIVPYGVAANVSDGGPVYREEWQQGAFDDQLVAGHRLKVLLNFEHGRGIANIIGKGVALRSASDGLHGSFEVLETQDGDKALALVNSGILDGVSLEAYAKKSVRTADGIVRRVKAHLHNVALCRTPAFVDARVLAVREEDIADEVVFDEELLPIPIDPEIAERCRRLGLTVPQRYEAHPAETDTPAQTGTSADGTRQAIES